MIPIILSDETRRPGKPKDWDNDKMGECEALSIYDHVDESGFNRMISGWKPDEAELEILNRGGVVFLSIYGLQHPVVSVYVPEQ